MRLRFRVLFVAPTILSLLAGCGGKECAPTDASCQPPDPRYELILVDAPPTLAALVLTVRAGGQAFTLQVSPTGTQSEAGSNGAGTEWRAVILGRPGSGTLGTITLDEEPASAPVATILEAAGGVTQGYALLSTSMRVDVRRVN